MSIQSKIVIVAFSSQGEFVRRAEMIFSAKYFNLDEDSGSIDGDRILERISAIPLKNGKTYQHKNLLQNRTCLRKLFIIQRSRQCYSLEKLETF